MRVGIISHLPNPAFAAVRQLARAAEAAGADWLGLPAAQGLPEAALDDLIMRPDPGKVGSIARSISATSLAVPAFSLDEVGDRVAWAHNVVSAGGVSGAAGLGPSAPGCDGPSSARAHRRRAG